VNARAAWPLAPQTPSIACSRSPKLARCRAVAKPCLYLVWTQWSLAPACFSTSKFYWRRVGPPLSSLVPILSAFERDGLEPEHAIIR